MMLHDAKLRQALAALLVLVLTCLGALPAGAEPAETVEASYGALLADMLASYEDQKRLNADAALLDDDVARAIASIGSRSTSTRTIACSSMGRTIRAQSRYPAGTHS